MIAITITADAKDTNAFLVRVAGELQNPLELNAELGARLENELRKHFLNRNTEPNKKGWAKTGFWQGMASDMTTAVTATVATARPAMARDSGPDITPAI
jgi:anti-sigma-K factor RskA